MTVRLSFSTNAYVRHSVEHAVERIAALGYAGVELLADAPHLFAPSVTDARLAGLKELIDRTGIRVANVNANTAMGYYEREFWEPLFEPSLAAPDPVQRRRRMDYTRRCIDMAVALGSPCVSVTAGRAVPGTAPERSREFLLESLRELAEHAAGCNVRIGIEYEPGLLIECCAELLPLLNDLGAANVGANLDLGHSRVLGEVPEEVTAALGEKIFHVHIEDIRGRKHYHLIPGMGDMDFPRLFRALDAASFDGFATVELYTWPHDPDGAAAAAMDGLRRFL